MGLMELGCKYRGYGRGIQPAVPKRPRFSLTPDPTGDIGTVRGCPAFLNKKT